MEQKNVTHPTLPDKSEQAAKIFATALLPGGWIIQTTIEHDKERAAQIATEQQRAADRDKRSLEYVKLAKEILTGDKEIPKELVLATNRQSAARPFDPADLDHVIAGSIKIP
jgi:hypothetical protein